MRSLIVVRCCFPAIMACALSACTATPVKPDGFQGEYDKPLDVVRQAGIDVMTSYGFEITQNHADYIEGHRPRGLLFNCGGGEGVGIWLEQTSPSRTRARISSEKSFVGMGCQKEWTGPLLSEMQKNLDERK